MKKEKKWKRGLLSALCAVSLLGAGVFTACSSDEDDSDGSSTGGGSGPAGGQKEAQIQRSLELAQETLLGMRMLILP